MDESFLKFAKIWWQVSDLLCLSSRSIRNHILPKMEVLLHIIHLILKKVNIHRCLFKNNLRIRPKLPDNSGTILLTIIIKPTILLLLLEIVIAPLSGEPWHLSLVI